MILTFFYLLPQHTFQVLTKRADRLAQLSPLLNWTDNIWMGVSVEDDRVTHRIDSLRNTSAAIKFLSLEPLIGPLPNLNLLDIDWVIVSGKSVHKARPIKNNGSSILKINAFIPTLHSSLNNRLAKIKNLPIDFSTAKLMIRCRFRQLCNNCTSYKLASRGIVWNWIYKDRATQ